MVERKVPAYNRLKTDCVALRSVWLRTRMAGGVGAGGVNAPRYPISTTSASLQFARHLLKPLLPAERIGFQDR